MRVSADRHLRIVERLGLKFNIVHICVSFGVVLSMRYIVRV
jgi:hypothetical protein